VRLLLVVLAFAAAPSTALACAACACGDPTLVPMGHELPFAGRLRVGLDFRLRSETEGEATTREQRVAASVSWSPVRRLTLALSMPVVRRRLAHERLADESATRPGDLETWARVTLLTDKNFAPIHRLELIGGLKLPTGTTDASQDGVRMSDHVQPGTGSWDASLGAAWVFRPPSDWSAYASALVTRVLVQGPLFDVPLTTLRSSVAVQRGFGERFAARLVADGRVDVDGLVLLGGADLLVEPVTDLLILVGGSLPVAGPEGPSFRVGVSVDL
jgi:hypothetical protein